jgi:hypothetical protein
MAKLKIDNLQQGMVVAADIKNLDDMLLFPAGCELSERHIRMLRTWGINEILVETPENDAALSEPFLIELSADEINAMKSRYWCWDEQNPAQQEIFRLMVRRKTRPCAVP